MAHTLGRKWGKRSREDARTQAPPAPAESDWPPPPRQSSQSPLGFLGRECGRRKWGFARHSFIHSFMRQYWVSSNYVPGVTWALEIVTQTDDRCLPSGCRGWGQRKTTGNKRVCVMTAVMSPGQGPGVGTPGGQEYFPWCAAPGGLAGRCRTESLGREGQATSVRAQLPAVGRPGASRVDGGRRSERLSARPGCQVPVGARRFTTKPRAHACETRL